MTEKNQKKVSRRKVLQSSGMLIVGQTAADEGCNFVTRALGLCDTDSSSGGGDGFFESGSGSGEKFIPFLSRADHPTDEEIGEGNVAIYILDGTLYQRAYASDPVAVTGAENVANHDNSSHSTNMVEDNTTTGNAPYEIQKDGSDGTGVINFKTS